MVMARIGAEGPKGLKEKGEEHDIDTSTTIISSSISLAINVIS
jgi:hypothetical protein